MKKIFTLTVLLCLFNSCKKDYVCKCTDWNSPSATYQTIHDTKENAKKQCEGETHVPEGGCRLQWV